MSLLDPRVWLSIIVALFVAYAGGRLEQRAHDNKRFQAEKQAALVAAQDQRMKDIEAARIEEQRRTDEQRKIADDATKKADAARADAVAANDAASRLRLRVNELLAASRSAKDSSAASTSAPAKDSGSMLADLLQESVERARLYAEYADQARISGLACVAAYESLTGTASQ